MAGSTEEGLDHAAEAAAKQTTCETPRSGGWEAGRGDGSKLSRFVLVCFVFALFRSAVLSQGHVLP